MHAISLGRALALGLLFALGATAVSAAPYLLVSGRWDNTILVIDLAKVIEPSNDGTQNEIVSRVRVTPDLAPNTPASGQPVNVVLSPDRRFAYVVNHSGSVTTKAAADFQHGHAGTVTVVNVTKALDPANNMTLNAVEAIIPTGNIGPVGLAVTADGKYALVSGSEGDGPEDGGRVITVVDLTARKVLHHLELALGNPGFPCPPNPIPHAGPNPAFGCFTDTNGIVVSPRHGGILFTANGGTNDVSVIDVGKYAAITGAPRVQPGSGVLWVVDIAQRKTVDRVSGVGNETYLLALLP